MKEFNETVRRLNRAAKAEEPQMKNYCVKSNPGWVEYLSILNERDDGYIVRIIREQDGYEKILEHYMSKELFESCLRTGYISEIKESSHVVA